MGDIIRTKEVTLKTMVLRMAFWSDEEYLSRASLLVVACRDQLTLSLHDIAIRSHYCTFERTTPLTFSIDCHFQS
jgi:hypothetical protein